MDICTDCRTNEVARRYETGDELCVDCIVSRETSELVDAVRLVGKSLWTNDGLVVPKNVAEHLFSVAYGHPSESVPVQEVHPTFPSSTMDRDTVAALRRPEVQAAIRRVADPRVPSTPHDSLLSVEEARHNDALIAAVRAERPAFTFTNEAGASDIARSAVIDLRPASVPPSEVDAAELIELAEYCERAEPDARERCCVSCADHWASRARMLRRLAALPRTVPPIGEGNPQPESRVKKLFVEAGRRGGKAARTVPPSVSARDVELMRMWLDSAFHAEATRILALCEWRLAQQTAPTPEGK